MTKSEWLEKARTDKDKLISIVSIYHPVKRRVRTETPTAARAQEACDAVSAKIAEETKSDPVSDLEAAINSGDIMTIYGILQSTWFGVPETTACWQIEGFSEAVDLLDNLPCEENEVDNGN